ncbi:REP-associated tyrosine transposase [Kaistella haifensis]|uniref:REP-associated tyrosine transposase n=1 Tax=Kaistella haifensis TaxID=421525 RepID=UPI00293746AF|nr:transposase [Kaistella haifensis]
MMSRNYKFHNPEGLYFISFAVVGWLDVFTRNEYKDLFLDSLRFCQKEKGFEIHAWCIMSSHVQLVFRSIKGQKPELLIGDLKRYTSKSIVKAIEENPRESRKQFLLEFFKKEGAKSSNVTHYQFWRHDNKPIELWSNRVIKQKIDYVHQNPVEAGLVYKAQDYIYSSARDYADEKGLLDDICCLGCLTSRKGHTMQSCDSGGNCLFDALCLAKNGYHECLQ